MDSEVLNEVPLNLRKLVQMVVRGFYTTEDTLIVDMLCRNLCLSEDSICESLKFDRKMLRQRINTLKTDKLLQIKVQMIATEDGKQQREQFYFINYKSFVNVVKFKLDHIRKKLEMEDRDQTSRASFVCRNCQRTYTDLEADQLLDIMTGQLVCIICRTEVQEDMDGNPKHDSRILLTKFNEQMEPLFSLLQEVENIKLAAEFADPTPTETVNGKKINIVKSNKSADSSRAWSGENSKRSGFQVEGSVDVNISSGQRMDETQKKKEQPVWLSSAAEFVSTRMPDDNDEPEVIDSMSTVNVTSDPVSNIAKSNQPVVDDVMMLLQAHESKPDSKKDDSDSDGIEEVSVIKKPPSSYSYGNEMPMREVSKQSVINVPLISVGFERIPINDIDITVINRMTQQEKDNYIIAFQEYQDIAGIDD